MYKIIKTRRLAENVVEFVVDAPRVTVNARPGQFIILRIDEEGERLPFTICDMDKGRGTVTILVQSIGYSTKKLCAMKAGGFLVDFVGPLGHPTDLTGYNKVLMIGGGIGAAVVYPQAKFLKAQGKAADVIVGARNKALIMYEKQFKAAAGKLYITTDDGSYGEKGFVTDVLRRLLDVKEDNHAACHGDTVPDLACRETCPHDPAAVRQRYDVVFAVGPMPMMRAVCGVTGEYGVKTIVSMNSIMVDGTGMCGCCRVTAGGEIKYACVDGPEFDGHLIDWDEAINRGKNFVEIEKEHLCRLKNL